MTDIDAIVRILKKEFAKNRMPIVELIEKQTHDPFKILVATILSARTKDETTAAAVGRLFKHVQNPNDLSTLPLAVIEKLIYPVGFYKNKARFLTQLPSAIHTLFNDTIPDSVDNLVKLPGVGRKTANLVVAVGFNKPAICVDIHVHRISNRLGYVTTREPFATEMRLREILPKKHWITYNSYLVSFGQHLCKPVNPRCDICPIYAYCTRVGVSTRYPRV